MRFAATALLLTFALGCGPADTPPKKEAVPKPPDSTGTPGTTSPTPADPKAAAQKFVTDFFAAVKAKSASPDQLTADFKKVVAPPLGTDASGYSDVIAKVFLEKWAAVKADAPTAVLFGDVTFAAGKPGPDGRVLMRLVKDGGAWKADWLSNGPPTASEVSLTGGEDTVAVLFAVAAFTDAALKKDYALAAGLMTLPGRARIAPPFKADADADRGYNPGLLKDAITEAFGKADRAVVADTARNGGANEATVKVELTGGAAKQELTLKLVKGAKPGAWLVDSFELK